MKKSSQQELYERKVKIERRKLSIKSNIFCVLSAVFMLAGASSPVVAKILATIARDDTKMKVICIFTCLIYLALTVGLSSLFAILSLRNDDDFMPTGRRGLTGMIYKHRSEILAERKLEKKGLIKCQK